MRCWPCGGVCRWACGRRGGGGMWREVRLLSCGCRCAGRTGSRVRRVPRASSLWPASRERVKARRRGVACTRLKCSRSHSNGAKLSLGGHVNTLSRSIAPNLSISRFRRSRLVRSSLSPSWTRYWCSCCHTLYRHCSPTRRPHSCRGKHRSLASPSTRALFSPSNGADTDAVDGPRRLRSLH